MLTYYSLFNLNLLEDCLIECCKTNHIPFECLEEENEIVAWHNATHRSVRDLRADSCLKFVEKLNDCKTKCK